MVPHLVTALSGPINELEQRILDATPVIERWFRLEWMEHTPPLYCSVDIRAELPKFANWPTFPQLWVEGELVGGCDIMIEMFQAGELQTLIKETAAKHKQDDAAAE